MKTNSLKEYFLLILVFLTAFSCFLVPIPDADTPWHLKTGEFILKHMELPYTDPFSFVNLPINEIGSFILKQYWLAQIIIWKTFETFGYGGLLIFVAGIFSIMTIFCLKFFKSTSIFSILFVFIYFVYFLLPSVSGRPQIFTFLFSLVTLYVLFEYENNEQKKYIIFLPLLFLFWANMHGGFIYGFVIIFSFLIGKLLFFKSIELQNASNVAKIKSYAVVLFFCLFCTLANPNGYEAFLYAYNTHSTTIFIDVLEYSSPFNFNKLNTAGLVSFWLTIPLSILVVGLGSYQRKFYVSLLISITIIMTFTAVRYYPLLVIVTCAGLGIVLPENRIFSYPKERNKRFLIVSISLILFASFIVSTKSFHVFNLSCAKFNPQNAIRFLKENNIYGNIYGSYNKSGFLILGLYPESKVFWSSNFISEERFNLGQRLAGKHLKEDLLKSMNSLLPDDLKFDINMLLPTYDASDYNLWLSEFSNSQIDIVVHEALNDVTGKPIPLVFFLLDRKEWVPVYFGGDVIIFLKNTEKFRTLINFLEKPKSLIAQQILLESHNRIYSFSSFYPAMIAYGLLLKEGVNDNVNFVNTIALRQDNQNYIALFINEVLENFDKK